MKVRGDYCLECNHKAFEHEISMNTPQRGLCLVEGCECMSLYTPDREQLGTEVERLLALINTPQTDNFMTAVPLEAAHQIERWGTDHDEGKAPMDWFWLIGYLAQKAATAELAGDIEKAKHHTISTSAVMLNWFRRLSGEDQTFRPGIAEPKETSEK